MIEPTHPAFCTNCGHNLRAEVRVALGPLAFDPRGLASWHGRKLQLTRAQFLLLGSLVAAAGAIVTYDVLAERAGYDGEGNANDVVHVLFCRIRGRLRQVGAPPTLIKSERARGYSLDVGLLAELAGEGPRSCL